MTRCLGVLGGGERNDGVGYFILKYNQGEQAVPTVLDSNGQWLLINTMRQC
ncbi:MAG: hypothetical protein R8K48_00165 [Gallionella sp.]